MLNFNIRQRPLGVVKKECFLLYFSNSGVNKKGN